MVVVVVVLFSSHFDISLGQVSVWNGVSCFTPYDGCLTFYFIMYAYSSYAPPLFWYSESLNFEHSNCWCSLFSVHCVLNMKMGNKLSLNNILYKKIRLTLNFVYYALQEMEGYIRGLIPNLAQLHDMPQAFIQMYCRIAARKFFFFCDPHRRGLHGWHLLAAMFSWCSMIIFSSFWTSFVTAEDIFLILYLLKGA